MSHSSLEPNTILQRRYKILGILAHGKNRIVYQARDLTFSKQRKLVAVKEIPFQAKLHASFQRETALLTQVDHYAIPKLFDSFEQNREFYLVTEYINGLDLAKLMSQITLKPFLPFKTVVRWALQLCDVLTYLHTLPDSGVIVRNIAPSNIVVDSFGAIRLVDFSACKLLMKEHQETKFDPATYEGYAAPEIFDGISTPQSDIYSLGAVLQHMTLTHPGIRPPFGHPNIQQLKADVPESFAAIIERALATNPDNRFQSAAEMKVAIENCYNDLNSAK